MKAPFFAALTLVCLARLLDGVQGRTLEAPPPRHPLRHRPEVSAAAAAVVAEPRRSLKALRAAGAAVKVDDDLDDGAAVPEKASTASKVESAATTTTTNRRDGSHAPAAASSGVIIRPAGPSKQYAWVGHGNFVPDHKLPIDIFHAANLVPKWLPSVDPVFAANLLYPGAVASAAASSAPALSSYASSRVVKDVKRQRDDLSPAAAGSSSSNNPFLSSVATAPNQVKPGQHRRPDPPSAKVTSSGRGDLVRLVVENDDAAAVKQAAAVVDKARKSRPRQPPSPFKGFLTATQSDGAPKSSGTFFNLPLNIEEDKFFGGLGDPFVRGVKEQGADPREVFYVFYEDPSASPAKGKAEVKAGAEKKPNVAAFSKKPLLLQQHGGKQRETPSGHGQQRFPAGPELLRPQRQQPQNLQQVFVNFVYFGPGRKRGSHAVRRGQLQGPNRGTMARTPGKTVYF